jgi:hypothetical protein
VEPPRSTACSASTRASIPRRRPGLDIVVAGDESYNTSIDLPHGFPSDGARFVYRPAITSGTLTFYFDVSNESTSKKFGEASKTDLELKPHGSVQLDLTLRPLSAPVDMAAD